MTTLSRQRALALLNQCRGDEIWNLEYCRDAGVPDAWIAEMADTFESGFKTDRQTIYVDGSVTNQYRGVRDLDLAVRLGKVLQINVDRLIVTTYGKRHIVQAIKDAVFDGE